ncbi:PTS mannose transporter subunit IIA, partial [Streptococcus pyogenes]
MKRKFLIGSHGRLASGLQSSIDILAGMGQALET